MKEIANIMKPSVQSQSHRVRASQHYLILGPNRRKGIERTLNPSPLLAACGASRCPRRNDLLSDWTKAHVRDQSPRAVIGVAKELPGILAHGACQITGGKNRKYHYKSTHSKGWFECFTFQLRG